MQEHSEKQKAHIKKMRSKEWQQKANQKRKNAILKGKIQPRTKTGCMGVKIGYNGKFIARIGVDGKQVYLGSFDKLENAVAARKAAEEKYWETEGKEK